MVRLVLAVSLLAADCALVAGAAQAQIVNDVTPLGRSAASGAVCQAVRDYDDPLVQRPAARAWSIRCLGWDVPIGRLYRLPAADAVAAWNQDLARRAACQPAKSEALHGFSAIDRRLCSTGQAATPYLAYVAHRGRFTDIAEGYAPVADVLEAGLKISAGVMAAPSAAQVEHSQAAADIAADFGGEMSGLASAEKAAETDSKALLARGYVQNSEWRFDAAETDFRSLATAAESTNAPPAVQAQALLNWALNVSNSGRFAEAGSLFDQADALVMASGDQSLKAEALNYRAYHLRNQRRFADAIDTAEQAIAARAQARKSASFSTEAMAATTTTATTVADPHTIDPALSDSLNIRTSAGGAVLDEDQITPEVRLDVQDGEALEIEGSSKLTTNDLPGALAALNQAREKLKLAEDGGADTAGLRARVEADVADLDLASDQADAAAELYQNALKILRTRHAGSPPEGGLLLDLGRALIAGHHNDEALAAYGQAFSVFKEARGSLGLSADAAEPYLDLLIDLGKHDPAHAADYAARFFAASEAVVSDATASTISRLAARVASGDAATAGLVRAIDDTRREVNATESRIASMQAHNTYAGEAKATADADLKQLLAQLAAVNSELLSTNPRYNQLVSSDVSLGDLQTALRPDEAYVKILLLADRGYGILISHDAAIPYVIPLGRHEAVTAAMALRAPMDDESLAPFDIAGSHTLFSALFGPVAEPLLKARHLIYEPDSALVSLPVGVFVTDDTSADLVKARPLAKDASPDYRGVAWLGAKLDSSLVLSAASFLQARAFKPSHAAKLYLAYADPTLARSDPRAYASLMRQGVANLAQTEDVSRANKVCGATRAALLKLEDLPDTNTEAHMVAASLGAPPTDVITGSAFNDGSIRARSDFSDYRIVYFATHALLPMPDACLPEPALVTSLGGEDSDSLLSANDIVNLKLDADLVVLSACDTGGAGDADPSGSGLAGGGGALGGLTRAFIYAGARGMIVSHWAVDSAATVRLMTALFRSGAPSEAEGLQRAQAEMQSDAKLSHPYYWAPFTIVGDGARAIPSSASSAQTAASAVRMPSL